jgi:hypothetical protein
LTAKGRCQASARLLGAAETLRVSAGVGMFPFVQVWIDRVVADTTAALGTDTFRREWQAGRTLPRNVAVAHALRQLDEP